MKTYGIFCRPETTVYDRASETKITAKGTVSAIADQCLYGMTCKITEENGDWLEIITGTGYAGFIYADSIITVSETEMRAYTAQTLYTVNTCALDVVSLPAVQGVPLITLPGGSVIAPADGGEDAPGGWMKVRLADGREGYAAAAKLEKKIYSDDFLFRPAGETMTILHNASGRDRSCAGGCDTFSFKDFLERRYSGNESNFRDALCAAAEKYLGVQYRWGGRSTWGLDCSGLVSMSYLKCGVVIYRDAAIVEGFPMKKIDLRWTDGRFDLSDLEGDNVRKGDALYFPGHIALYIGEGRYIHSTGRAGSNGVVINSLVPGTPDFREDLLNSLYAVGGLR